MRRLATYYRFLGGRGLKHELISPNSYLAARRVYDDSEWISKSDKADRVSSIVKADRTEPAC